MGVSYTGNCNFERDNSYILTDDKYGLGSLVRTYQGREDKAAEFMKKWTAGKPDEVFPTFKLVTSVAQGNGAFTTVTLNFNGLRNGELPKEKKRGGWAKQTATLKKLEGDQTVEIEYMAPTATFMYVTTSIPTAPRFRGKLLTPNVPWEIRNRRGDRGTRFWEVKVVNEMLGATTYTQTQAGRFNFARVVALDVFDFEQEGDFFKVIEVNVGSIIEPQRNDLPRHLNPDHFSSQTLD